MTSRERLLQRAELLSDEEIEHVLELFDQIAAGDRFWEGDAGVLYNEYVKMRPTTLPADIDALTPADPSAAPEIFAPVPLLPAKDGAMAVELPRSVRPSASLADVLVSRRSRRDFTGAPVGLASLADILRFAAGVTGYGSGYGYRRLPLRAFPSSGGLQAPEVYVSAQSVEGLQSGIYRYNHVEHTLIGVRMGEYGHFLQANALGQPYLSTAAAVLLVTGSYQRLRWKYGERSYRYMCIDVGLLAQNVHLVSHALGLGCCAVAGFVDDAIERLLNVDGRDEVILLLLALGSLPPS